MENRRGFLKGATFLLAGTMGSSLYAFDSPKSNTFKEEDLYLIGPKKGYTPEIGTLLSTMEMMRYWLIGSVGDLSIEQLDFQIDESSNSIGAMLLHLAATERYYQLNTFEEMAWGSWDESIKQKWDIPMNLGANARETIKGNPIEYYLDILSEVRSNTKKEFAKREDSWLEKSEDFFENKPTNNYCKWFHVCEHESNHRGQIKFILKRIPT